MDSDEWIYIMNTDKKRYLKALKKCVTDFKVLEYLKEKIDSLYCIQKRKQILQLLFEAFEQENYLIFINLVVIQIEGIFYDLFYDVNIQKRLDGQFDMLEKDDFKKKFDKNDALGNLEEATLYFKFYFNSIIRNRIAHGRIYYHQEELETIAYELILDLQYVIHLISTRSDTSAAIEYVQHTRRWLEHSFSKDNKGEHVNERLLNSLNANVIKTNKDDCSYTDPQQELYWIFNPYYEGVYKFAGVLDEKNKLLNYLVSQDFWQYVNQYLLNYNKDDFNHIKIKKAFKSRVKAIQMYIAKNKKEVLPMVVEASKKLDGLNFEE